MPSQSKKLDFKDVQFLDGEKYVINQVNPYRMGGRMSPSKIDDCEQSSDYITSLTQDLENYFFIRGFNGGGFNQSPYINVEIEGAGVADLVLGMGVRNSPLSKIDQISSSKIRISCFEPEGFSDKIFSSDAREIFLTKDLFNSIYQSAFSSPSSVLNFLTSFASRTVRKSDPCYFECGKVKVSAPINATANTKVIYDVTLVGNLADFKTKKYEKRSLTDFSTLPHEAQRHALDKHFIKGGVPIRHNVKIEADSSDIKTHFFSIDNIFDQGVYCPCVNSSGPGELLIHTLYDVSGTVTTINLTTNATSVANIAQSSLRTECSRNHKVATISL